MDARTIDRLVTQALGRGARQALYDSERDCVLVAVDEITVDSAGHRERIVLEPVHNDAELSELLPLSAQHTPGQHVVSGLAEQIRAAEEDAQTARYSGNAQAQGYAEGRAHRAKRRLAVLDPRGYGHPYLSLLTSQEREAALRGDRAAGGKS